MQVTSGCDGRVEAMPSAGVAQESVAQESVQPSSVPSATKLCTSKQIAQARRLVLATRSHSWQMIWRRRGRGNRAVSMDSSSPGSTDRASTDRVSKDRVSTDRASKAPDNPEPAGSKAASRVSKNRKKAVTVRTKTKKIRTRTKTASVALPSSFQRR